MIGETSLRGKSGAATHPEACCGAPDGGQQHQHAAGKEYAARALQIEHPATGSRTGGDRQLNSCHQQPAARFSVVRHRARQLG